MSLAMAKLWLGVDSRCVCTVLPTMGPGPISSVGSSQKRPP